MIDENSQRLDMLVNKESMQRRKTFKYKIDQLKYDCHRMHSTISNTHTRLTNKWRNLAEREELLTQRSFFVSCYLWISEKNRFVRQISIKKGGK